MTSKAKFAFPTEHEVELKRRIKEVKKIVTIGWKAGERNFLKMLNENLPQPVNVLSVCENEKAASNTLDNLALELQIKGTADNANGFSDFVQNNRIESFLSASGTA
jgi:hypothetical protein